MPRNRPKTRRPFADQAKEVPRKPKKLARLGLEQDNTPLWRLALLQVDQPWSWTVTSEADLLKILAFLSGMEREPWKQIRQKLTGDSRAGPIFKQVPMEGLCPEAQTRLRDLELDDYDGQFWRFRLGNFERLWGVLQEPIFYPLWWDPEHEVCP